MKRAVVVGSQGQDGKLLCDLLTQKKYTVVGISKKSPEGSSSPLDIFSSEAVATFLKDFQPHEIYYLAAFHHSAQESLTDRLSLYQLSHQTHVVGPLNFLEAMVRFCPQSRFFYAASSLIFGDATSSRQNESSPFNPDTLYGQTKLSGLMMCRQYRNLQQIYAATGILYNHESPLRSAKFVSQKIIETAVQIKKGLATELIIGDLDAITDWSYAPDVVEAMVAVLAHPIADDFVIASGVGRTIKEFVETTFGLLGLSWKDFVKIDPTLVKRKKAILIGDPQKIKTATGWQPKTSFSEMIRIMLEAKGITLE